MGRFFSPIVFLAGGAYVLWFNNHHADRALVFPLLSTLMPSLAGDMKGQGLATVGILLGIGALLGVAALLRKAPDQG